MEEKDFRAFELVQQTTGHPTAIEMIEALQRIVDVYRPSFDKEQSCDPFYNTKALWSRFFKSVIDVHAEIIIPALARRSAQFGHTELNL